MLMLSFFVYPRLVLPLVLVLGLPKLPVTLPVVRNLGLILERLEYIIESGKDVTRGERFYFIVIRNKPLIILLKYTISDSITKLIDKSIKS